MIRALTIALALAASAAGVYYLSEARRLRAHVEFLKERAVTQEQRAHRIEARLFAAQAQSQRIQRFVAKTADQIDNDRAAREAAARQARRPMPEAVRLVLVKLNECLREDGHEHLRFLRARSLEERALIDVEAIDRDGDNLRTTFYVAGRVELALDRGTGVATIRFRDGYAMSNGRRIEVSEDGVTMPLDAVQGPHWEHRLGHMLETSGAYPPPPVIADARAKNLDAFSVRLWALRIDRLLTHIDGDVKYAVGRLGDLRDGMFQDLLVHGYGDKNRLERSLEAKRAQIRVDPKRGIVSLFLLDGTLHEKGGDRAIPTTGYRMYLPGVTPDAAREVMLGMVVDDDSSARADAPGVRAGGAPAGRGGARAPAAGRR